MLYSVTCVERNENDEGTERHRYCTRFEFAFAVAEGWGKKNMKKKAGKRRCVAVCMLCSLRIDLVILYALV